MNRRIAVLQARMGSTRFPGKVLAPIAGLPALSWTIRRIRAARCLDEIVVATTDSPHDDVLEAWCHSLEVACFRGDEQDVLGRFLGAAQLHAADWVVRINADNPFIDPTFIDALLAVANGCDYVGYQTAGGRHTMLTGIGLFTEALSMSCLERAADEIKDPWQREHVTLGIYTRPDRYHVRLLTIPPWSDLPWLRLTMDTPRDHRLLDRIAQGLGDDGALARGEHVIELVARNSAWVSEMHRFNSENPKTAEGANR